jgi:hypothetical protein
MTFTNAGKGFKELISSLISRIKTVKNCSIESVYISTKPPKKVDSN